MVRSMVLRGFDRDMVNLVQSEMEDKGVKFLIGKIPVKVSKQLSGKLLVEWTGDEVSCTTVDLGEKRYSYITLTHLQL